MSMRIRRRELPAVHQLPMTMPPLLQRLHAARGAVLPEIAEPKLAALPAPGLLKGLSEAVAHLRAAIAGQQRIVVVGDFDCDGATGCAVAVRGLQLLGARNVGFAVPDRQRHGYGLSPALVEELVGQAPALILTVDTGIACIAGVAAAKARGWQVVVTDHHLPGEALPEADAIVNPNQPGCDFPAKTLAGVGVMFYLLLALRASLREAGEPAGNADLNVLLDWVAVGTVADMVPLDAVNRALVGAGLRRIRKGQGSAGIRALIDVAGRRAETLTSTDIGYAIGPRINAAGRLEDMTLGIACLLSEDAAHAATLARLLDDINQERRAVQAEMLEDAERLMPSLSLDEQQSLPVYCLYEPHWHPGVVGLVASKVKEKLHRPVIAFAPVEVDSPELRGSARSIAGFHVRDALAAVDARYPGLITRFGGHAMAAGLSLPLRHLEDFRAAFSDVARQWLNAELLHQELLSDGELQLQDFTHATACLLRDAAVWGQHYPEPLFDGEFDVLSWRPVGNAHLKLELGCAGKRLNAIHFGGWDGRPPPARLHVAYRLVPDDWRGGDAIQLIVVHRQPIP